MQPDDQDYQWPACFVGTSKSPEDARRWGNHLAQRYASRTPQCQFLHSSLGDTGNNWSSLPVVAFGEEASDDTIGW